MIKWFLQKYQNDQRFKQSITLFSVNVVTIPLSVVSSIVITSFLGSSAYGDFGFLFNVFGLGVVVFAFGFFDAGSRALVLTNDKQKAKEYYGAELVILGVLFLVMVLFMLGFAFIDKNINEKGLRNILIFLVPFSWTFLLVTYFEVLLQADNKISLLAKSRLYPKIGFFLPVLIIYLVYSKYPGNRLIIVWIFFLISQISVFLYIIHKIGPSFYNLRTRISDIFFFNKVYGLNVYFATLFSGGLSQLTGLLISYFGIDNTGVGYFALATTISAPLALIPNVIATTYYKDFSTKIRIPRKLLLLTIALSCSVLLLILLLVRPFIKYLYKPEFYPVISLTYIVSIGVVLSGLADFFNRFLGSHGDGKAQRNSALLLGISLLAFNITLIPLWGETGAAYTRLLSGLIYILSILWFYRRLLPKLKKDSENDQKVIDYRR